MPGYTRRRGPVSPEPVSYTHLDVYKRQDVNLPLIDGIEATRIVSREYPSIAVIGISVRNDPQVHVAMTEAGAVAFLPKESAASQLYEIILRHCPAIAI